MHAEDIKPSHLCCVLYKHKQHKALRLNYWDANTCKQTNKQILPPLLKLHTVGCIAQHQLLFIALYRDKAECLEKWPEIKVRCIRGPFLDPEGSEILFDPTQRTSVCQVKPAHCSMGIKACPRITMKKNSLTGNRAIFVLSVDLNYMHARCCK